MELEYAGVKSNISICETNRLRWRGGGGGGGGEMPCCPFPAQPRDTHLLCGAEREPGAPALPGLPWATHTIFPRTQGRPNMKAARSSNISKLKDVKH